ARNGAGQALYPTRIAHRPAHGIDVTGDGRLGNDAAAPHRLEQVVLADDTVAMAEQMQQKVEDLRPDIDHVAANAQFPALLVEHVVFKHEQQGEVPWWRPTLRVPGDFRSESVPMVLQRAGCRTACDGRP